MAVIDLKNVTIYFEDGTSETGAVNLMAGYMAGATTIVVDGIVGVMPAGARLEIDGDDRYTIVSTVETSGNTTSITFTPALANSIADNDVVIIHSVYLAIKVGDGTLTWSEKKPREYKMDRGRLDSVRDGDETPMDVSIELMYEELTAASGATAPTPEDFLKRRGLAAALVSAQTDDPCAPFCINIRADHQPPTCTTFEKERVLLQQFRYEELNHDVKAGTISCTGKCNVTEAVVTRIPVA